MLKINTGKQKVITIKNFKYKLEIMKLLMQNTNMHQIVLNITVP